MEDEPEAPRGALFVAICIGIVLVAGDLTAFNMQKKERAQEADPRPASVAPAQPLGADPR